MLQKVKEVGGTYLCGVNYCAMDKYPGPATAAGLKNCTSSLKVQCEVTAGLDQISTLCSACGRCLSYLIALVVAVTSDQNGDMF